LTVGVASNRPEQLWTKLSVLQLLNEVQLRYEQLTDRVTRNKAVWKEVSAALQKYILGVTGGQCDQKCSVCNGQCTSPCDQSMTKQTFQLPLLSIPGLRCQWD